jgi:hypothetical protein
MRNSLALISDIGSIFGAKVSNEIKTDFTANLVNILGKFSGNPENQSIIDYAKKVFSKF